MLVDTMSTDGHEQTAPEMAQAAAQGARRAGGYRHRSGQGDGYGRVTRREGRPHQVGQPSVKEWLQDLFNQDQRQADARNSGHRGPVVACEDEGKGHNHSDRHEDLRVSDLAQPLGHSMPGLRPLAQEPVRARIE